MGIAYLAVSIVLAAMVLFSGIGKLRHDPHIVKVIHETVGVPMNTSHFWLPVKSPARLAWCLESGGPSWVSRPRQGS